MRILKPVYGKESRKEERISRLEVQLPHGAVSTVRKTQLALWINKEPVKWSKYRVKVIVFFALNSEDTAKNKGYFGRSLFTYQNKGNDRKAVFHEE